MFDPYEDLKFYALALFVFFVFAIGLVTCSVVVRKIKIGGTPSERCESLCGAWGEKSVGYYSDRFPVECICLAKEGRREVRIVKP